MKSKTRQACEDAVIKFADYINKNTNGGEMLYVGTGGDNCREGEYAHLFKNYKSTSLDICPCYNPHIVGDINKTEFENNSWDLIIAVQMLEHNENIFDMGKEIDRILKPGGYFIIDCPFMYPFHAEEGFMDLWRVTKDGMKVLFGKYFGLVDLEFNEHNTSCLYKKPL